MHVDKNYEGTQTKFRWSKLKRENTLFTTQQLVTEKINNKIAKSKNKIVVSTRDF